MYIGLQPEREGGEERDRDRGGGGVKREMVGEKEREGGREGDRQTDSPCS